MNAVEREPVQTRVLNPPESEASYKPKQRSYRKTNIKKKVLAPDSPGAQMSGAEISSAQTAMPNRRRQNGGAETVAPKRTRPQSMAPMKPLEHQGSKVRWGSKMDP